MTDHHKIYSKIQSTYKNECLSQDSNIQAALRVIALLRHIKVLNEEQQSILASAHYTLALQNDISLPRSKMHTNTAIALLQNIKNPDCQNTIQLANAYFKRAEILELEESFSNASKDYLKAIEIFQELSSNTELLEEDILLLAQAAISIADLIVHENILDCQLKHSHPLYYINKALEYLARIQRNDDELWITLAYAHQIAGLVLYEEDSLEATEAFRSALSMAFKAEPKSACLMLGEIYQNMGLSYQFSHLNTALHKNSYCTQENAIIYFGTAKFFESGENLKMEDIHHLLDSLYDTIYRVLDPFLSSPLSSTVLHDFIDALIFGYYCISTNSLPNQLLCQTLQETELMGIYAHHIYCLITEAYRRENPNGRLLELADPKTVDLSLDITNILDSILNANQEKNSNIIYLKKNMNNLTTISI